MNFIKTCTSCRHCDQSEKPALQCKLRTVTNVVNGEEINFTKKGYPAFHMRQEYCGIHDPRYWELKDVGPHIDDDSEPADVENTTQFIIDDLIGSEISSVKILLEDHGFEDGDRLATVIFNSAATEIKHYMMESDLIHLADVILCTIKHKK